MNNTIIEVLGKAYFYISLHLDSLYKQSQKGYYVLHNHDYETKLVSNH